VRFGVNLRRERIANGLTQERLAELADLNPRTVQKIEAGGLNILLTVDHPSAVEGGTGFLLESDSGLGGRKCGDPGPNPRSTL